METCELTVVTAITAILTAGALIYDVCKKYKKIHVSFVQVSNKNEDGADEFRTNSSNSSSGAIVKGITIYSDNRVEIELLDGKKRSYASFIYWRQ